MRTNAKIAMAAAILVVMATFHDLKAQVRIGLQLSPAMIYGRVSDKTTVDQHGDGQINYKAHGVGAGFSAGAYMDYFFRTSYALNIGVRYTNKRQAFVATRVPSNDKYGEATYNLQMLQIPVGIKLFTNEVVPDWKLYFMIAGSPDFVLAQKVKQFSTNNVTGDDGAAVVNPPEDLVFKFFDASLWFSLGTEYRVAESTTLTAGFSYNRGLINLVNKKGALNEGDKANQRYSSKADLISLDLGVKF